MNLTERETQGEAWFDTQAETETGARRRGMGVLSP